MKAEPFFFASQNAQLFGVWRGSDSAARVWVLCPPFAEEEKSARRTLTEIALAFAAHGESSLVFSFRGTGDSKGDFSQVSFADWRADIAAACWEAKNRAPNAQICVLGVRLGASLALQCAAEIGAARLILIEPILGGRSFLMQMNARKKLRAQLTGSENSPVAPVSAIQDLDGWPLGNQLRDDLNALDLRRETPKFGGKARVFQVGPRAEVAPPLQNFADQIGAQTQAIVMPAFWNLLDYTPSETLIDQILTADERG